MFDFILFLGIAVLAFVLTAVISHFLIPVLASRKMGQKILEIGPRWHKSKEGTPTMGGIAFLITAAVLGIGLSVYLCIVKGTYAVYDNIICYGKREEYIFMQCLWLRIT